LNIFLYNLDAFLAGNLLVKQFFRLKP
jgi:hypothetical protein